ncbi:hypothetical protein NW762_001572 [Fusarium torreyae]|uniref:DUF7730 domain-containing protein n=1 Tax=Fusarium torreyae TaxID=1237075 RepID=A0A9W8SER2_9HYPO|nr:hypothetical protein NW762_001572 [Fusarium torreyae]
MADPRGPGYNPQPGDDECVFGWNGRFGFRPQCQHWPGERAQKCSIGVMGWLISCREAYQEGIEVLYSRNTFHTASKDMVLGLYRLIPEQRLDAITSFEIIWEFAPWLEPRYSREEKSRLREPRSDFDSFEKFMDLVPRLFTNIRKLYIALQGDLLPDSQGGFGSVCVPPEERAKRTEEGIIMKVDEMAARMNFGVDLSVSFPTSIYARQRWRALQRHLKVVQRHDTGDVERFWRPLKDCLPRTGYWFCLGEKDLRRKAAVHVLGPKVMPRKGRGKAYDVFFRPGPSCA